MKKLIVSLALIAILIEGVIACTIEIPSLRKEFRQANSVFAGKVIEVQEVNLTKIEKLNLVPES